MPTLHRNSANPSGYDPFPSGYDFINDPAANSPPGAGVPAPFDGKKSGGPDDGTYFFGFGDDNTAAFINRPINALSDNTDTLDNYLRRPLAIPTRTADVTVSGSPISTITLPGPPVPVTTPAVYLGTTSLDSYPETVLTLFDILDANDDEIIDPATGVRTVVSSITSTSGFDVIGSGFALGTITLNLNQSIPIGQDYRVYYGEKSSLAFMPPDAFTIIKVRGAMEVPAAVEDILNQITNPGTVPETVTALVATTFQTSSGRRLAQSAVMYWDLDPEDSSATVRTFYARTRRDTIHTRTMMRIDDDPTSSLFAAYTGRLLFDAGMVLESNGTMSFMDVNTVLNSGTDQVPAIPLTGGTLANGDQQLRIFEQLPIYTSPNTFGPSMALQLNARWACSIGDGTHSFGDFTGPGALDAALTYIKNNGFTDVYLLIKQGTYTLTGTYSIPMDTFVIVGAGASLVTIETNNAANAIQLNGLIKISGVTFSWTAGATVALQADVNASLYMSDVGFVNCTLVMVSPTIFGNVASFYADRCAFTQTTATNISCDFQIGSAGTNPDGFFFNGCSFNQGDETQPVRFISTSTTTAKVVGRVRFRDCEFYLGGTATASGALTHNTGVIEINPNGHLSKMTMAEIVFDNCNVQSLTTAANGPVARIYGCELGAGSLTHRSLIVSVTIRGGLWSAANASSTGTAISPVFIAAQSITIEDVTFLGNLVSAGGPQPDDQFILDNIAHTAADWAQFIFAPGAAVVEGEIVVGADMRLSMHNVTFSALEQSSTSGDAWFFLGATSDFPNFADVDGVRFTNYFAGTVGSRPTSRVRITVGCTMGGFKNVSVNGGDSSANTDAWTNSGAIVVINPSSGQVEEPVTFENIAVYDFIYHSGVTKDGGILVAAPGSGSPTWFYTFRGCKVQGQLYGLAMGGGGTGSPLDGFVVEGGDFSYNDDYGIGLTPDNMGDVKIRGNRCIENGQSGGNYAIYVSPGTWQNSFQQGLTLTDNYCRGYGQIVSSTECLIGLLSSTVGDHVFAIVHGNTCVTSTGSTGGIEIQDGSGGALTSPAQVNNQVFVTDAETGNGVASSANLLFQTGQLMMRNLATLVTP